MTSAALAVQVGAGSAVAATTKGVMEVIRC